MEYVAVPRGLYEKVKERGFDPVDLLLLSLSEKLELDPGDEASFRLELSERHLEEAVTEVAISLNICEYF